MLRTVSLFLLALCLLEEVSAQNSAASNPPKTYYELTPGADLGELTLPYDSSFTLKIHLKQKENLRDGVMLIAGSGHKKLGEFLNGKNAKMMKVIWDSTFSTFNLRFDYYYNKVFTDRYNAAIIKTNLHKPASQKLNLLIPAGPLKPAKKYSIVVIHDIIPAIFNPGPDGSDEGSVFTAFYKLAVSEEAGDAPAIQKDLKTAAFNLYTKVWSETLAENITTLDKSPDSSYTIFKNCIYPLYKDNNQDIADLTAQIASLDTGLGIYKDIPGFRAAAATLLHHLQQQQCCTSKKGDCCKYLPDSAQSITASLQTIWDMRPDDWHQINSGKVYFQNQVAALFSVAQAANKNSPSQNIVASLGQLISLRNLLSYLEILDSYYQCSALTADTCLLPVITKLKDGISGEVDTLNKINLALAGITKLWASFKDIVIRSGARDFKGIDIYNTDSYILDFQTRTSVYITPIFGYAMYGLQDKFTDFTPYLGFQVNFEPMNRNVPFRLIREKTLWQRLCLTTAWTLRSVSYPGKRADFFGGSASLITALGFKFSHVIMFNIGSLWFKEIDPDPLITTKKIVCTPVLSLSINFSVGQLLNGFTSLIPSL